MRSTGATMRIDILDVARFWSKVAVTPQSTDCWLWRGYTTPEGYGQMRLPDGAIDAHRLSMEMAVGGLDKDVVVRHKCDTPLCVNPLHLETGTHADNVRDRVIRGRTARGTKNGRALLDEEKVRIIRSSPFTNAKLAVIYGVSKEAIDAVRRFHSWKHVT